MVDEALKTVHTCTGLGLHLDSDRHGTLAAEFLLLVGHQLDAYALHIVHVMAFFKAGLHPDFCHPVVQRRGEGQT